MLKFVCIFAITLLLMADIVRASMTICDCETAKTCRQGETQKGTCTIGGVVSTDRFVCCIFSRFQFKCEMGNSVFMLECSYSYIDCKLCYFGKQASFYLAWCYLLLMYVSHYIFIYITYHRLFVQYVMS